MKPRLDASVGVDVACWLLLCGNSEPDTWSALGKPAVAAAGTERAKAPGDAGMRASATDVSGLAANDPAAVAVTLRWLKLIGQLRAALRSRHYRGRAEQASYLWVKWLITVHHLHLPAETLEAEITTFLTYLAIDDKVSTPTQDQALSVLFLFDLDRTEREGNRGA